MIWDIPSFRKRHRSIQSQQTAAQEGEDPKFDGDTPIFDSDFGDAGDGAHDDQDHALHPPALGEGDALDKIYSEANAEGPAGMVKLIAEPQKTEKITVNYAKTSKNVDVKALKHSMWRNLQPQLKPAPEKKDKKEKVSQTLWFTSLPSFLEASQ